jgi:DNA-binding NarL/FixJ family response regulator
MGRLLSRPTERIRIAIADDHELSRVGLNRILSSESNLEIVGEATDGDELLAIVERWKPDIVLIDIMMPRRNGLETAKELRCRVPAGKPYIIMLTTFEDRLYIEQALAIGVDGYLSKDVSREELITSLQSVMKGERVFSHSIFSLLHGMHSRQSVETLSTVTLTKREEEILDLVAKGLTSNEIANRLFISPRTVETHRAHLMEKLGAKNTAALVRYAIVSQQHRRPGSPTEENIR